VKSNYGNFDRLTPVEMKVLLYAAEGLTGKETAKEMKRSVETVKTHRCHVLKKLQARNIAHAFAIASRSGLVK
jgi:DNA-binding CsgD family transcriptional regulator